MTTKLAQYIAKHTDEVCAERFNVKVRTVASWRRGENFPRAKKAKQIVALTGGEVTMEGIYSDSPDAQEQGAAGTLLGSLYAGLPPSDRAAFEAEIVDASASGLRGEDLIAEIHTAALKRGAVFSREELLAEYHAGRWVAAAARASMTWLPAALRLLPGPREVHDRQFVKSHSRDLEPAPAGPAPLGTEAAA